MKRLMYLFVTAFCIAACTSPESDEAKITEPKEEAVNTAGEKYTVDASASKIEWIGTKVSGYHTGTVNVKGGELTISNGTVTAGNFMIDMPTIIATGPERVGEQGNKKLTGHLHTADFFDVQKFPESTFVITSVKPFAGKIDDRDDPRQEKLQEYKVADPTHTVSGNLTMRGITKNIE